MMEQEMREEAAQKISEGVKHEGQNKARFTRPITMPPTEGLPKPPAQRHIIRRGRKFSIYVIIHTPRLTIYCCAGGSAAFLQVLRLA